MRDTNNQDIEDEQVLVSRLINGDEAAFCSLYATYKNRLLYFAMRFVKSREFAEDIFQDAFTIVWQSRRFINPDKKFSSYLYTIMYNRILNFLRDLSYAEQIKEQFIHSAVDATADDSTWQEILAHDLETMISQAVEQLTPRQREVFEMSRTRQMSHKEIAETLGITVNAVQMHISQSLQVIRTYLSKCSASLAGWFLILFLLGEAAL